jgi:phytoene/squalene synthetase
MLLPKEERARLLALRALNVETLLVPSSAGRRHSSGGDEAAAMLRIRYQWWRDAVRAAMVAGSGGGGGGGGGVQTVAVAAQSSTGERRSSDGEEAEEEGRSKSSSGVAAGRARAPTTPPPPAHPVVTALWAARASAGPRLHRYPLRRLIDAREREALATALSEPPPRSLDDLEAHGEATHSQLLYAQMAAVIGQGGGGGGEESGEGEEDNGDQHEAARDHAASHAGKAVALAMALRGLPYAASKRARCLLPLEVLADAGLSQEDLFRRAAAVERGGDGGGEKGEKGAGAWTPRQDAALRDAALAVASRAVAHLGEARALAAGAGAGRQRGRQWAHALLPAVAADCYLGALERTAQFDVFHPALRPPLPPPPPPPQQRGGGAAAPPPPPPPLGAGLGVSPLRYLLSVRWHVWRGTF